MPSYCNNKLFTKAIVDYQKERRKWKAGKITDEPPIPEFVGKCILLICSNLASRGNFSGYSWRSDFISDGVEKCVAAINNFDVKKATSGAYGYMTRIAWRAFLHRIEKENDQTYAKLKNYERFYVLDEIIQCQTSRPGEPNQKINTIFTDAFVEKFEAKLARKKQPKKKTKK